MNVLHSIIVLFICFALRSCKSNDNIDYLEESYVKQVQPLQTKCLALSYKENVHTLGHLSEPWQQSSDTASGTVWVNPLLFAKQDTLLHRKKYYYSKKQQNDQRLLFLDYGDEDLYSVTETMLAEKALTTTRYTPITILNLFRSKSSVLTANRNKTYAIYKTPINKSIVEMYIRKSDSLVEKITVLSADGMYGDVKTTFRYEDYSTIENLWHPGSINLKKINGKIEDIIVIHKVAIQDKFSSILEAPSAYEIVKDPVESTEVTVEKHSKNIHFIDLLHTDDKVMLVEFKDFLLVAEAPLNSKNGELIISEAKKITPNKPIKYFVFGHHHPHYLGGVRPFVAEGAEIICSDENQSYVKHIAEAPHTLNPDRLQKNPKPLQIKKIKDSLTITDGVFKMDIYFIGEKSQHTKDYLIYHFPSEKLLFEDDLAWIPKEGEIKKASKRQAGLYQAIKELNLEVDTLIQSWPVKSHKVKMVIPFKDLEVSMNLK